MKQVRNLIFAFATGSILFAGTSCMSERYNYTGHTNYNFRKSGAKKFSVIPKFKRAKAARMYYADN